MAPERDSERSRALDPVVDPALDKILDDYSRVEPAPEAMRVWLARRADPLPSSRFLWLPAPAWAAIALALLMMLGLTWFRARRAQMSARALLANERTVVVPLNASQAEPLTDEQKQLIQLLQTDPAALATTQPGDLTPPKSATKPTQEKHP